MPILVEGSSSSVLLEGGRDGAEAIVQIIGYRAGERSVFLYGFGKSERDNIDDTELAHWRITGRAILGGDPNSIEAAIADGHLSEVDP